MWLLFRGRICIYLYLLVSLPYTRAKIILFCVSESCTVSVWVVAEHAIEVYSEIKFVVHNRYNKIGMILLFTLSIPKRYEFHTTDNHAKNSMILIPVDSMINWCDYYSSIMHATTLISSESTQKGHHFCAISIVTVSIVKEIGWLVYPTF